MGGTAGGFGGHLEPQRRQRLTGLPTLAVEAKLAGLARDRLHLDIATADALQLFEGSSDGRTEATGVEVGRQDHRIGSGTGGRQTQLETIGQGPIRQAQIQGLDIAELQGGDVEAGLAAAIAHQPAPAFGRLKIDIADPHQAFQLTLQADAGQTSRADRRTADPVPAEHHLAAGGRGQREPLHLIGTAPQTHGGEKGDRSRLQGDDGLKIGDRLQACDGAIDDVKTITPGDRTHLSRDPEAGQGVTGLVVEQGGREGRGDGGAAGRQSDRRRLVVTRPRQGGSHGEGQAGADGELGCDDGRERRHGAAQRRPTEADPPLVGGAVEGHGCGPARTGEAAAGGRQGRIQRLLKHRRRGLQIHRSGGVGAAGHREAEPQAAPGARVKAVETLDGSGGRATDGAGSREAIGDRPRGAAVGHREEAERFDPGGHRFGEGDLIALRPSAGTEQIEGEGIGAQPPQHPGGRVGGGVFEGGGHTSRHRQQLVDRRVHRQGSLDGVVGEAAGRHGGTVGKAETERLAAADRRGRRNRQGVAAGHGGWRSLDLDLAGAGGGQAGGGIDGGLDPEALGTGGGGGQGHLFARQLIDEPQLETLAAAAAHCGVVTTHQLLQGGLQVGGEPFIAEGVAAGLQTVGGSTGPVQAQGPTPFTAVGAGRIHGPEQQFGINGAGDVELEAIGATGLGRERLQLEAAAAGPTGGIHRIHLTKRSGDKGVRPLHLQIVEGLTLEIPLEGEAEAGSATTAHQQIAHPGGLTAVEAIHRLLQLEYKRRVGAEHAAIHGDRGAAATTLEAIDAFAEAAAIAAGRLEQEQGATGHAALLGDGHLAGGAGRYPTVLPDGVVLGARQALHRELTGEGSELAEGKTQRTGQLQLAGTGEAGGQTATGREAGHTGDLGAATELATALGGAIEVGGGIAAEPDVALAVAHRHGGGTGLLHEIEVLGGEMPGPQAGIVGISHLRQLEQSGFAHSAQGGGGQGAEGVGTTGGRDGCAR